MYGIKEQEMMLAGIMEYIGEQLDIEWELALTDIEANSDGTKFWATQVLIIQHKNAIEKNKNIFSKGGQLGLFKKFQKSFSSIKRESLEIKSINSITSA